MKVIKRIRRETPQQKLRNFYHEMGIITKVILVLYTITAFILSFAYEGSNYSFLSLFFMRITEIVLFVVIGVSDLKREEQKGSFYLFVSFLCKNFLLWIIHKTISVFVARWPDFGTLTMTAIPIQYLFMVSVEDAFSDPEVKKYFILYTFQLKARFYPLFIFVILMITAIRVDLILPFFLGIGIYFGKINSGVEWLTKKFNQRFVSERMTSFGFIKQGKNQRKSKPLDELATNDSIFLEEK